MSQKAFYSIAGTVFLIVGIVHLLRVVNGWPVTINNLAVPMWASWLAVVIAALLAYNGLKKR